MTAQELYDEVKNTVLHSCDTTLFYSRVNDALDFMSNLGHGMYAGMIGETNLSYEGTITLPPHIRTPISISVFKPDGNEYPIMPRDMFFRHDIPLVDGCSAKTYSWYDEWFSPLLERIPVPSSVYAVYMDGEISDEDAADIEVVINAATSSGVQQITVPLNNSDDTTPSSTTDAIYDIFNVNISNTTGGTIYLYANPNPTLLGTWNTNGDVPIRRNIRLHIPYTSFEGASTVRMIYKLNNPVISSMSHILPLVNKLALIQAIRAVNEKINGNAERAAAAENDCLAILNREDMSNNCYLLKHTPNTVSFSPPQPQAQQ